MPFEVVMPRLGWNMEKGILVKWNKKDGELVQVGDILFVVEADKATQEVEALESGVLYVPPDSPPPGSEMPVGTLLGYLLEPGEKAPVVSPKAFPPPAAVPLPPPIPERPAPSTVPARPTGPLPHISPRARRVAGDLGVDWALLQGSGRTGRIVERDIRRAVVAAPVMPVKTEVPAPAAVMPRAPEAGVAIPGVPLPITQVRRLTAERMAASAHTVAAVTLTTEVDATELVRLRKQLQNDPEEGVPSYNDLLTKLLGYALVEHPYMNVRLEVDAIVQYSTVNVGIAVDSERGLLVPVLRDVQAKPLLQIVRESAELIDAARTGRIDPADLRGGTITITNLGMYDIDAFTPIINLPECAILGVGRILPKQMVIDADAGRVAIRHMMFLSLTFDHRLVDGAPAARFLQRIKQYIEQPFLSLLSCSPSHTGLSCLAEGNVR